MKTIVITGASEGIGLHLANYFYNKNYKVICGNLNAIDAPYTTFTLNVADEESVNTFVKNVAAITSQVDVLINNAGYGLVGAFQDLEMQAIKAQFDTNYFGLVHTTQVFLPLLKKANNAKIINISSFAGLVGLPYISQYCASKYAIEGFAESIRLELKKDGIKIYSINPTYVNTKFWENAVYNPVEKSDYIYSENKVVRIYKNARDNGLTAHDVALKVEKIISGKGMFNLKQNLLYKTVQAIFTYIQLNSTKP